ncbi:hypothetical protein CERZMDRAFT_40405, partial [Cercospora zeae-maydis SCOH1-5]
MKLKYKKFGTCAHHGESNLAEANVSATPATARKGGIASACTSCRAKRTKCDSVRPKCGTCAKSGSDCAYDHAPSQQRPLP